MKNLKAYELFDMFISCFGTLLSESLKILCLHDELVSSENFVCISGDVITNPGPSQPSDSLNINYKL